MRYIFSRASLLTLIFSVYLSCFASNLNAAVYKCTVDGKLTFQQIPCMEGEQDTIKALYNENGLHNSWFDRPGYLTNSARCTNDGCQCGEINYDYQEDVDTRLLNAMARLQASWKTHSKALTRYKSIDNREKFPALKKGLERDACNISISQATVKRYFASVSTSVSNDYNTAVNSFDKIEGKCVKPDEEGWTASDEAKEYVRCSNETRKDRNKALRAKKSASSYYKELEKEIAKLKQPKP